MSQGYTIALRIFMLSMVGLLAVLYHLMPRLTRPDLYFAVTVPPDFRDTQEGRGILRRYRIQVWIHTLIGLGLVFASLWIKHFPALLVGFFWQAIGSFIALYGARKQVMPHAVTPKTIREAGLEPRQARLPGGWMVQLGPFAMLAAAGLWLHSHWEQIPGRFPVHWGFDGKPNRWAYRSFSSVYGTLLLGTAVCIGLVLLAYAILQGSRRIQVGGTAGEREAHFQHTVLSVLLGAEYFLALVLSWTGLLPLARYGQRPAGLPIILLLTLVFVGAVVYILSHTGQGGTRLASVPDSSIDKPAKAHPVGDLTLDKYWKAGVFYINRDDPALVVEKRFGIGYTLNFGHPLSWLIMALLVLVPLGLVLVMAHTWGSQLSIVSSQP